MNIFCDFDHLLGKVSKFLSYSNYNLILLKDLLESWHITKYESLKTNCQWNDHVVLDLCWEIKIYMYSNVFMYSCVYYNNWIDQINCVKTKAYQLLCKPKPQKDAWEFVFVKDILNLCMCIQDVWHKTYFWKTQLHIYKLFTQVQCQALPILKTRLCFTKICM